MATKRPLFYVKFLAGTQIKRFIIIFIMFIEMNYLHVSMSYNESSDRYERGYIEIVITRCCITLNLAFATFSYTGLKSYSFQFNKGGDDQCLCRVILVLFKIQGIAKVYNIRNSKNNSTNNSSSLTHTHAQLSLCVYVCTLRLVSFLGSVLSGLVGYTPVM